jgi:hypothetical protein
VEQQGDAQEYVREKAAMALTLLSINDTEFLNDLRTNPEAALWNYGFALSPQEMELVRALIEETSDLSDEEIRDRLEEVARRHWPW